MKIGENDPAHLKLITMTLSQRTAKISIALNIFLTLICFGLLSYALMQKTVAENQTMMAIQQREIAVHQMELAKQARIQADSSAMEALRQYQKAQESKD